MCFKVYFSHSYLSAPCPKHINKAKLRVISFVWPLERLRTKENPQRDNQKALPVSPDVPVLITLTFTS